MPGLKNVLAPGGKEEDVLAVVFDEMKTVLLVVVAAGGFLAITSTTAGTLASRCTSVRKINTPGHPHLY